MPAFPLPAVPTFASSGAHQLQPNTTYGDGGNQSTVRYPIGYNPGSVHQVPLGRDVGPSTTQYIESCTTARAAPGKSAATRTLEGGQTHTLTGKAYIPTRTLSPEGNKKLTIGLAVALPGAALVCGGVLVGGVVYKVLRPKKPASSATTGPGPLTNTHTASRRNSVELVNRTPIQAQVAAAALV